MSNLYAALPKVPMELVIPNVETGKKEKVEILTSPAHRCYRKFLGFNDQSDAKRSLITIGEIFQKVDAKVDSKTDRGCDNQFVFELSVGF